jgi:hypothetical protein
MQQQLPLPPTSDPRALISLLLLLLLSLSLSLSASRSLSQGQQLHAYLLQSGCIPCSFPSSSYTLLSSHLITFYSRCNLPLRLARSPLLPLPPPFARSLCGDQPRLIAFYRQCYLWFRYTQNVFLIVRTRFLMRCQGKSWCMEFNSQCRDAQHGKNTCGFQPA